MLHSFLQQNRTGKRAMLWTIYAMSIFFTLHYVVPLYVNSTYLGTFTTESIVGIIYTVAAFLTIIAIIAASRAVEKYGNYRTTAVLIAAEIAALAGLAVFGSLTFVLLAFLAHFILTAVIKFNIDIFIESVSDDENTGKIRGAYLTSINAAFILAPTLAGIVLTGGDWWKIYLLALLFLLPVGLLLIRQMKNFSDSSYRHVTFVDGFRTLQKNSDIFNIFLANLLLKFFYAWMIIYTPIYLHNHIGMSFAQIGPLFSIMLVAFVLVEIPLGKLADEKYGEKELLTAGFILTAITTAVLSFITTPQFVIWAVALFITRIGAAMIEIMTETYFFKKIDAENTDYLAFFRMTRPAGYIGAPILASVFIAFFPIQFIFVGIGAFMLLGLPFSLAIHDTR